MTLPVESSGIFTDTTQHDEITTVVLIPVALGFPGTAFKVDIIASNTGTDTTIRSQ